MAENELQIMHLHTTVLKCLLVWPISRLTKRQNAITKSAAFLFSFTCSLPVFAATGYQVSNFSYFKYA